MTTQWLRIKRPKANEVWYRGQKGLVEWEVTDESVTTLKIGIKRGETKVSIVIGSSMRNMEGKYEWERVSWGFEEFNNYFVSIEAVDQMLDPITSDLFSIHTLNENNNHSMPTTQ